MKILDDVRRHGEFKNNLIYNLRLLAAIPRDSYTSETFARGCGASRRRPQTCQGKITDGGVNPRLAKGGNAAT